MLRVEVKKKGLILFMKKIYVKVMYTLSDVMVPDYIANNIKKYTKMFDKWLLDKDNNHGYWVKRNGRNFGVRFDVNAFVLYLNEYVVKEKKDKVYILEEDSAATVQDDDILIYF